MKGSEKRYRRLFESAKNGILIIDADTGQLDQIMANLCVNARDVISGVSKITVETAMVSFGKAYCYDQKAHFIEKPFSGEADLIKETLDRR